MQVMSSTFLALCKVSLTHIYIIITRHTFIFKHTRTCREKQNRVHDFRSSYAGAAASSLKMGMPNGLRMSWMTCWDARSALLTNEPSAFSSMSKSWSLLGNARKSTRAAAPAACNAACCSWGVAWEGDMLRLGKVRYIYPDAGVPKG